MEPLIVSSAFLIATIFLAMVPRFVVKACIGDSLLKNTILEFIASSELCACCFEVLVEIYGISAGCSISFILMLWWALTWSKETACPYRSFEEVLEGQIYPEEGLVLIIAQVFGALFISSYVQSFWELELTEYHAGRDLTKCTTDLKVDVFKGFVIEGAGTCIGRLVSRSVKDVNSIAAEVVRALCIISLVIAGADFTGGYYNPAIATSMKIGCKGINFKELFFVYWLGPFTGSFISIILFHLFAHHHNPKGLKAPIPTLNFFPDTIEYGKFM